MEELLGKTIISIRWCKKLIEFVDIDGIVYTFCHFQDCCETVMVDDVTGDFEDLLDSPLVMAEEVTEKYEEVQWTFYKFATVRGYVTVRWWGCSDSDFYSMAVDLYVRRPHEPTPEDISWDWADASDIQQVCAVKTIMDITRDAVYEEDRERLYAVAPLCGVASSYAIEHLEKTQQLVTAGVWLDVGFGRGNVVRRLLPHGKLQRSIEIVGLGEPDTFTVVEWPEGHPLST